MIPLWLVIFIPTQMQILCRFQIYQTGFTFGHYGRPARRQSYFAGLDIHTRMDEIPGCITKSHGPCMWHMVFPGSLVSYNLSELRNLDLSTRFDVEQGYFST